MFSNLCFSCICFVLVSSTTLSATEIDIPALQKKIYSTIAQVTPAVVSISVKGGPRGFSGVIVSKDGHVLSAAHTVRSGENFEISLPDGRSFDAIGQGTNLETDCALIQITSDFEDLPYVQMGVSKSLAQNQPCLSISYPSGQLPSLTPLVRFGRMVPSDKAPKKLQSTALMEPGDSGGPLFDLEGRVIGIHSSIGDDMAQNYEVPIDAFRKFWNELNRQKRFTYSGPSVPSLGIWGPNAKTGIAVRRINSYSLAGKHGIKKNDVIKTVHGIKVTSVKGLTKAMVAARDDGAKEIIVKIQRKGEEIDLNIPFKIIDDGAPEVKLPEYEAKEFPKPTGIAQLANLPEEFSDLESELDDACVDISSIRTKDGEALSIIGTRIKSSRLIISKNSMVGPKPMIKDVELEVVSRDEENDLVLLRAQDKNTVGVDISLQSDPTLKPGSFMITPDSNGPGLISVLGSKSIASKKNKRTGYLGVRPVYHIDGPALARVTDRGAAKRAGLKVGDIITKLDETTIASTAQLRQFLNDVYPGLNVVATIIRDGEEMKKTIRMEEFTSEHPATKVATSARRDGFTKVILHDAALKPAECGSPVFDLKGNFIGVNISRHSRVRSFVIPSSIVKTLVETAN